MHDSSVARGFFKVVTAEDQEARNRSLGDGPDNSQRDIEWIYGAPELDLLTHMQIQAPHCALRHQARGVDGRVSGVLRLSRRGFLNAGRVTFARAPARLLSELQRCGRHAAAGPAYEYAVLETTNGGDESLRGGVVRAHADRLVIPAI